MSLRISRTLPVCAAAFLLTLAVTAQSADSRTAEIDTAARPGTPAEHLIAIRAGNVVDPATGQVAKNQTILVENGHIKAIGAGVSVPSDTQVIDLSGEWIFPELMDAHTHITPSSRSTSS